MNTSSAYSASQRYFSALKAYVSKHKIRSAIFAIIAVVAIYWLWGITHTTSAQTRYVLSSVTQGTIIQVVSGSGQVSPSNQVTINPQASGQITQVLVKNGQTVSTGQPIAYINATDKYNAVENAKASLQSAQLALQKLQEPPTQLQITQDQNAVTKDEETIDNAQTTLSKTYQDSYNDIVSTFLSLPNLESDIKDVVTGTEAAKGAQWNIDYYQSALQNLAGSNSTVINQVASYRANAFNNYQTAVTSYNKTYADYQSLSATSATSTIATMLTETYSATQDLSSALNSANSFIQYYQTTIKNYNQNPTSEATTAINTLTSDINTINTQLSTLLSDSNAITNNQQSLASAQRQLTQDQQTLQELQAGPDALDIQSDQLNIQQQQNSLQQAENALSDYTITAPFAGTIANLNLNVGDTVSNGTAAATLITNSQIVSLSLNEVDAAKVAVGQQATLTFDAIPGLTLTGTVIDVSPLGTVTSGVVSYTVKIGFTTQDSRVKAGMTVNANIQSAVHSNVLEIPASAIQTLNSQTYVEVFNPPITGAGTNSTSGVVSAVAPVLVPVTIGITDNTNTEIVSGLTLGEQIVKNTINGTTAAKSTAAAATSRGGLGGGGATLRAF